MNFVFSRHALEQLELRNIPKETVETILQHPEKVINDNGNKIYQSVLVSGNEKHLIRIFVNTRQQPPLIITVYKTSKISKYHEGKI